MKKGPLNRRLRIQRPVTDTSFEGAGSGNWELVAEVWANVEDRLPSRGEQLGGGINVATRPARVRIRYRTGVDSSMRALIGHYKDGDWITDRTVQIITQPAEMGRHDGLEFMVADYSSAGGGS